MSRIYRASQRLRPRNKFFHSVIAGCGFAVIIVALIALTNFAASRMESVSAARADAQSTAVGGAAPTATPQTTLTPKSKLNPKQTDTDSQSTASAGASSKTAAPQGSDHISCNTSSRQQIVAAFTGLLNSENTAHKHNLSAIIANVGKTSLFTQILNPGMLNSKISAENQRHQQAIRSLTSEEVGKLTAIHCKLQ